MASSVKYHKTYLKLHKEYETYAYPLIKKALDEQIKAVTNFTDETNFDDLQVYIQFLVDQKPLYDALEKIYTKVGVSSATFSYDWIRNSVPKSRKDFIIDFFNPQWYIEMVEYFRLIGGTKVQGIDQTTMDKIKTVLADILGRNLSRRDQARLFEETLNDPAFNRARSLVIARTESTTAANHGINVGAESSDYEVNKFWINTKDKRTRRTHLAMTNERIPINQPFLVGSTKMMYPGDVGNALNTIPAAEVVNCRCVMATEALVDADGLPILKPRTPPYLRNANTVTLPKLPTQIIQPVEPTTIDEAKIKALRIFNQNTKIRINDIEIDKNIPIKELNEKINQFEKLSQEYNIGDGFNNKEKVKLMFKTERYLYGYIETFYEGKVLTKVNFGSKVGNGRINFNPESINLREFSKIDSEKLNISTTTHEFGHLITIQDHMSVNNIQKSFWKDLLDIREKYKIETRQYRSERPYNKNQLNEIYLGRYAETNPNEFLAEAFTEYKLSSNPSKYALQIGNLIDKYFKKK